MPRRRDLLLAAAASTLAGCARDAELATRGPRTAATSAGAGTQSPGPTRRASRPAQAPDRAAVVVARLDLTAQVGQLLMVGLDSGQLDAAVREALDTHKVGSLVLLGQQPWTRSAAALVASEVSGVAGPVPVWLAADQEGGRIQRLAGQGFQTLPSAVEQGRLPLPELTRQWTTWGRELKRAGVHWNLAPVADWVPAEMTQRNAPIGALQRHYGGTPEQTAARATAVVKGLHAAGVATSMKHFPGLGRVATNTDFGQARDTVTRADRRTLGVHRTLLDAQPASVMVSSAVYEHLDARQQATFSPLVIGQMLRRDLRWDGVVISDDLGAAASVQHIAAGERAVRFVRAGGDVVINADPTLTGAMAEALVAEARRDSAFADLVRASCVRVVRMKQRFGS